MPGGSLTSPEFIIPGEWHYVVGSFEGDRMKLWVDGERVRSTSGVTLTNTFDANLWLGSYSSDWFTGLIDEVMILRYGFDGVKLN